MAPRTRSSNKVLHSVKLSFNADIAAIALALGAAALVRLHLIPAIGW